MPCTTLGTSPHEPLLKSSLSNPREFYNELDVVLLAFGDISYNTGASFVSVAMELEICVVSDDEDWVNCAFKQIVPVLQSSDYG
jgi:hypothetical protein